MATAIAAAACFFLAASSAGDASVEQFQGIARLKDGSVAYVETHIVHIENGRIPSAETRYTRADGSTIARLVSDYRHGPFAPDYEFQDLRTGAREMVRRAEAGIELFDGKHAKLLFAPEDVPLVTGQGLDRYARAHLDELARGEILRVSLALPGRLDTFGFQLRGERIENGRVRVQFEPTSFFLRILAPSLDGEYDLSTRHLVRYVGTSNVAADDGSSQQVEIAYSYFEPTAI